MDNKARIVKLYLEFANLKQENIENIAEFVSRVDLLAEKTPDSQMDISMAVIQGILDPNHKEKLLFKCAQSKSFIFSIIMTFVKTLYFFRGKDNPFDPSYKELRSIKLPSSI